MRAICITAYPAETIPQMLAVLLRHSWQITLCARFICQDPHDAQEQLQLERTFWVRSQLGTLTDIVARVLNIPRCKTLNQDVEQQIAEVDAAIAAAAAGMPFGWCTITATRRSRGWPRRPNESCTASKSAWVTCRLSFTWTKRGAC